MVERLYSIEEFLLSARQEGSPHESPRKPEHHISEEDLTDKSKECDSDSEYADSGVGDGCTFLEFLRELEEPFYSSSHHGYADMMQV